MEEMATIIGNYGFPIIISMYLLIRTESKLDSLTSSILHLTSVLEKRMNP